MANGCRRRVCAAVRPCLSSRTSDLRNACQAATWRATRGRIGGRLTSRRPLALAAQPLLRWIGVEVRALETVTINRAPVLTLWATVVAERLG
jgi:hypothetical protein